MRHILTLILSLAFSLLTGCASYTTPGGPADFSKLGLTPDQKAALTDASVQRILDKKPLLTFPASIAVARVQAPDYTNYYFSHRIYYAPYSGHDSAYSIVTTPDVETDADLDKLAKLPDVNGIAPIRRILLTGRPVSDLQLREAAAKIHANLLLVYTFDTSFHVKTHLAPLSVFSLGLLPNEEAHVTSTASALLMDTNNGYIYAVLEATDTQHQPANAWTSDDAVDDARKRAERNAFTHLLDQFTTNWPKLLATYKK
ncbi:MAG: hypothetical protein ACTHN5_10295 [Phycisphaerae bacterium]